MLTRCLESVVSQTFKDYEVVVSDSSPDDHIFELCKKYDVKHVRGKGRTLGSNTNNCIKNCTGEYIKILFQDDYLYGDMSLEVISENLGEGWLATACVHDDGYRLVNPHQPLWSRKIPFGENTIGAPSVIAFENKEPLLFDEKMEWLVDCDYYQRLYLRYGEPKLLNGVCTVIGIGPQQLSQNMITQTRYDELLEMIRRYA
jgi:glycosyltransferase involved in cell wall biosynthesis